MCAWLMKYPWWRYQMETFSALLAFCAGKSPVTGQWRRTLMVSLICPWTNVWVHNRHAGDLRRHCSNYDVTVMQWFSATLSGANMPRNHDHRVQWFLCTTCTSAYIIIIDWASGKTFCLKWAGQFCIWNIQTKHELYSRYEQIIYVFITIIITITTTTITIMIIFIH